MDKDTATALLTKILELTKLIGSKNSEFLSVFDSSTYGSDRFVVGKSDYQRVVNGKIQYVHDSRIKHVIDIHKFDVKHSLSHGKVGIISAGRNTNSKEDEKLSDKDIEDRYEALEAELKQRGIPYTESKGVWKDDSGKLVTERSFLLNLHQTDNKVLSELGKKFNQDSVIHVDNGKSKYLYTTGENAGKGHPGEGFEEVGEDADSGYTEVMNNGKKFRFSLNLDWDKLED